MVVVVVACYEYEIEVRKVVVLAMRYAYEIEYAMQARLC